MGLAGQNFIFSKIFITTVVNVKMKVEFRKQFKENNPFLQNISSSTSTYVNMSLKRLQALQGLDMSNDWLIDRQTDYSCKRLTYYLYLIFGLVDTLNSQISVLSVTRASVGQTD